MRSKTDTSDLARLKKEIRALKRENKSLKKEALRLDHEVFSRFSSEEAPLSKRLKTHLTSRTLYRKRSFFGYLLESLRSSLLYGLWSKIYTVFRRYRLAILLFEIFLFLVTFVQGGALFLFLSMISAALLPALFIFLVILSQVTARRRTVEKNRLIRALSLCDSLTVIPLPRKDFPSSHSLSHLLSVLVNEDPNAVILMISPYLFSHRSFFINTQKTPISRYVAAREESDRIFLLRGHFYFGIRSYLKERYGNNLTIIY